MSFKALLRAIAVVVEKLFSSFQITLRDQDEPWRLPEHDDLCLQIWSDARVVDETAKTSSLLGRVDTKMNQDYHLAIRMDKLEWNDSYHQLTKEAPICDVNLDNKLDILWH